MTSNDDAQTRSPANGLISRATPRLSRRRMLQGWGAALTVLGFLGITGFDNPVSVQAHEKEDAMSEHHGRSLLWRPNHHRAGHRRTACGRPGVYRGIWA